MHSELMGKAPLPPLISTPHERPISPQSHRQSCLSAGLPDTYREDEADARRRVRGIDDWRRRVDGGRIVIVPVGPVWVAMVVPVGSIPVMAPVFVMPSMVSSKGRRCH
jgi:hypothetical protein